MALKLNCLEPVTAMACGLAAASMHALDGGLAAGMVIGGAGLIARFRENGRKAGVDEAALLAKMQKQVLREWDARNPTQEEIDRVVEAEAAMTTLLPEVMLTREELTRSAGQSATERYPKFAARLVVDRLKDRDPRFANADPMPIEREFALLVIETALKTAMEDRDYAVFQSRDMLFDLSVSTAMLHEKVDILLAARGATTVPEKAVRESIARFIFVRPDAAAAEVVEAVERFEKDYRALQVQVAAIATADNYITSLKVGAEQALAKGDLDTARRLYREAAETTRRKASEPVRATVQFLDAEARTALLALDWPAADSTWQTAVAMLEPFEPGEAEGLLERSGDALRKHGEAFGDRYALAAASRRWEDLIVIANNRHDSLKAASFQNELGSTLRTQAERVGGDEASHLIAKAIELFRGALGAVAPEGASRLWGKLQGNLGAALWTQGASQAGAVRTERLLGAANALKAALTVQTEEDYDRATTHNNLGIVLWTQGARTDGSTGTALLSEAVRSYQHALKIRIKNVLPLEWAATQNNLGVALCTLAQRTDGPAGRELVNDAIVAYRAALTVRTETGTPADWSMTQNNLGIALRAASEHSEAASDAALLDLSISAYRAALKVRSRTGMPADWAMTQMNLANTLARKAERDDADRIALFSEAIKSYEASITVRTESSMPADWAMTKENMAKCFEEMAVLGLDRVENLRRAESALLDACRIYSAEHMSHDHKTANTALKRVRRELSALP